MKLSELEDRANNALDGMTVSKDRLAKDVLLLAGEVKRLREEAKREIPSAGAAFKEFGFGGLA